MSKILFYTHDKEDLVSAVRLIVNEIRQTELVDTSMPTEDEKLSQKAAAKLLGISTTTIIEWRKEGKIPRDAYMRIGRPIFYSKKKLLEYAKKDKNLVKASRK